MLRCDLECPTIDGTLFSRLSDLLFKQSDYFSFSVFDMYSTECTMQNDLKEYVYQEIMTSNWFNYITLPDKPKKRILYFVNDTTQTILKKHCHRLFLFDNECSSTSWNQTLEDVCFFLNGKLILGTVSHAHICEIFPPDDNFRNELFNIYPYWKEISDSSEQIVLSDYLPR